MHQPIKRSTRHISAKYVVSLNANIQPYIEKAEYFRKKWEALKVVDDIIQPTKHWSEIFDMSSVPHEAFSPVNECKKSHPLYRFRDEVATFIAKNICHGDVKCESYGSTKASSDIDVTIQSSIQHINKTIIVYIKICKFLEYIFGSDHFFENLRQVFNFFDVNFYLSNFAIKREDGLPDNMLSSYILSTAYEPIAYEGMNNQFYYACIDIIYKNHEVNRSFDVEEDAYINSVQQFNILAQQAKEVSSDNMLIDVLSRISTYEDECYHTQGAFFHVVMMMQRKIKFKDIKEHREIFANMLYASALENLTFAYTHFASVPKRNKYLDRYNDALSRLVKLLGTPPHSLRLPPITSSNATMTHIFNILRKYIPKFVRVQQRIV